jgi:hypothetical protein
MRKEWIRKGLTAGGIMAPRVGTMMTRMGCTEWNLINLWGRPDTMYIVFGSFLGVTKNFIGIVDSTKHLL